MEIGAPKQFASTAD